MTKEELRLELSKMATKDELRSEMNKQKLELLDAMDDKLANLKGDLTIMMRGEDKKVNRLIALMESKRLLTTEEAGTLLDLLPFPQAQRA